MGTDWSQLTASEWAQYRVCYERFKFAHEFKDYALSDQFRAELFEWQERTPDGLWNPVFEKPDHRQKRVEARGN